MTEEILSLMDERRKMKSVSIERFQELYRRIKINCREKKEEWLNRMCREIEMNKNTDSREICEANKRTVREKEDCKKHSDKG